MTEFRGDRSDSTRRLSSAMQRRCRFSINRPAIAIENTDKKKPWPSRRETSIVPMGREIRFLGGVNAICAEDRGSLSLLHLYEGVAFEDARKVGPPDPPPTLA
jgi:hypothetical protein